MKLSKRILKSEGTKFCCNICHTFHEEVTEIKDDSSVTVTSYVVYMCEKCKSQLGSLLVG